MLYGGQMFGEPGSTNRGSSCRSREARSARPPAPNTLHGCYKALAVIRLLASEVKFWKPEIIRNSETQIKSGPHDSPFFRRERVSDSLTADMVRFASSLNSLTEQIIVAIQPVDQRGREVWSMKTQGLGEEVMIPYCSSLVLSLENSTWVKKYRFTWPSLFRQDYPECSPGLRSHHFRRCQRALNTSRFYRMTSHKREPDRLNYSSSSRI